MLHTVTLAQLFKAILDVCLDPTTKLEHTCSTPFEKLLQVISVSGEGEAIFQLLANILPLYSVTCQFIVMKNVHTNKTR